MIAAAQSLSLVGLIVVAAAAAAYLVVVTDRGGRATLQHIEDGIAAATRPPLRYPSSYRRVSGVWRPA